MILQISPFAFEHPGGVEQYARTLQEIFPDDMITLAGGVDFPIVEPVKHFPFPAVWKRWFWNTFTNIEKENTKVIISHIRFAPTAWLAFWIAKRRGIPYIHIEHGTGFLVHKNRFIAWVAKMVDLTIGKYIIRHADQVITISQAGKQWVSTTFWRSDIEVIYRGFVFPNVERVKNEIPKIGFVGRLTGLKNVAWLLEALSELREEKWTLEIIGDGEEKANLANLMRKFWLTERVNFLGAKPHDWIMREFYPNVDIFVNPSLQEWLPTTVIEALGMGCQVIATDVGGTREISEKILVQNGDTQALKDTIQGALHRENTVLSIEHFSLENMKDIYSNFFLKIWK
jgi:glycosyltransferase involved in cell wall biosynthesis